MKNSKKLVLEKFQNAKIIGVNQIFGGASFGGGAGGSMGGGPSAGIEQNSSSTGDNDCTTKGGVGADCTDINTAANTDTIATNASSDACNL